MTDRLTRLRDITRRDFANRGLATVPGDNLLTACEADFAAACQSIAETRSPSVGVVTGFAIPDTDPLCGETDGPLGALFLARAFAELGIPASIISDRYTLPALQVVADDIELIDSPSPEVVQRFSHLIAVERVGPNAEGRCLTMRGRDVTDLNGDMHTLFENFPGVTIGIGDGGNEIGMGKIPASVIAANIPLGGEIACRVATDFLIVAGVSNWGAYGLAAGVAVLMGRQLPAELFDPDRERDILRRMVEGGPLVDGVTKKRTVTVDGLDFERYATVLIEIASTR